MIRSFNISNIIQNDDWIKFNQLNDSIIYLHNFHTNLNEKECKMKEIIHNIMARNIYKSIGEIITKEDIIPTIDTTNDNIIIDKIVINYNDYETCKYYQEKNIQNTISNSSDKLYILRIYTKGKEQKDHDEAMKIFNSLLQ